jgi:hypothetical protein
MWKGQAIDLNRTGQNWFDTLNEALDSEALLDMWPLGVNINYDETKGLAAGGRYITITRDNQGRYERPVHYLTKMEDTYPKEGNN